MMKELTKALALFVTPLAAAATIPAYANAGEVQGYMVDICKPAEAEGVEFADEALNRDFCSAQAAKAYKKFGTKDINFANKFVLTRMYGTSYVAIDPAKKQVFVMPFAIEDSRNSGKPGKITFKKNSHRVCTYGDDTSLLAYNVFSTGGDSSHPEYNLCIEFYPTEGFSQYYNPVHIKTGRIASRL